MPKQETSHAWLRETGCYPQLERHRRLGCASAILWALAMLGAGIAIKSGATLVWLPLLAGLSAFLLGRRSKKVLFNEIYCPRCGYNPTRRKADGVPRRDPNRFMKQLERYESCPECSPRE